MHKLSACAEKILFSVGEAAGYLSASPLTGFFPMKGALYNGELMVVGRAVNGWTINGWKDGITAAEMANPDIVKLYAAKVWESVSSETGCPMVWVSEAWGSTDGYNTRKSAFWRVIQRCVSGLEIANIDDDSWPSHLLWSNLYKTSPVDGGNPAGVLCHAQGRACIDMFHAEIECFKPRRLLFLTGGWSEPFWTGIASEVRRPGIGEIEATGFIRHDDGTITQFVVAPHPMGKPETPIVEGIISAFTEYQQAR